MNPTDTPTRLRRDALGVVSAAVPVRDHLTHHAIDELPTSSEFSTGTMTLEART